MKRLAAACLALLAGCGGGGGGAPAAVTPPPTPVVTASGAGTVALPPLSSTAALGQKMFNDVSLSASGALSCASCHAVAAQGSAPNALAVQLGGATGATAGFRASPSVRYASLIPEFSVKDGAPRGGYNHDGSARNLADQAAGPLLSAHEMANASRADFVAKLRRAAYADEFAGVFGAGIYNDIDETFARATFALQQYLKQDTRLAPFDAKFDAVLRGQAIFSPSEQRGLALFNDPNKGNCAACHTSSVAQDGTHPVFSDFSFHNLGVPRNRALAANKDAAYFDLGVCGRAEFADRADLCGAFKVPSLRNVASRKVFFHNGAFTDLREVVRFYARRDTHPAEWYPLGSKFDDVPEQYRGHVESKTAPYNRLPGMAPALTEAEIDDIVQFLNTLNDGFRN
ncbi:MAG TPA: cytochrome c peroxidase [Burkholderiaceae bacterium]